MDSASILKNPSFAETHGLLYNSICWADTPLLLRCFCLTNASKFLWKFLLFLNSEFPHLPKICQGRYSVHLELNCTIFFFFFFFFFTVHQGQKKCFQLQNNDALSLSHTAPDSTCCKSYPTCFGCICLNGHLWRWWLKGLPVDKLILFIHHCSSSRVNEPNVRIFQLKCLHLFLLQILAL